MAFRAAFARAGVTLGGIYGDAHRHDMVIYPLEALVGETDYQQRGSHCSDPGYLKIAQIALDAVGVSIDAFAPIVTTRRKQIDLAHMRGLPRQKIPSIRAYEGLKGRTRAFGNRSMIPGNTGTVRYLFNAAAPVRKRIVMFGDSFYADTLAILSPLVEELIHVRCPYVMEDVANATEPDIILTGNTERYLVNVPDKMRDAPFFTKFFKQGVDPGKLSQRDRKALDALFSGRQSDEFLAWKADLGSRAERGAKRGTGPGRKQHKAAAGRADTVKHAPWAPLKGLGARLLHRLKK